MSILNKYKHKIDIILSLYLTNISNLFLRKMIDYSIQGGKRIRPMIVLELCSKMNINKDITKYLIIAIELLHNASIILDDMPFMDDDKYRRNKLCLHKKYGLVNSKITANFMITEAYKYFSYLNKNTNLNCILKMINLVTYVNNKNQDICLGQYYDLYSFKDKNTEINETLIYNINLKTIPLFAISFMSPFIMSHNYPNYSLKSNDTYSKNDINYNKYINNIAISFSYMFQICDDFEDIEKDSKTENLNNHIKIIGKVKAYEMYKANKNIFFENIEKLKINSEFFSGLVILIDNKIQKNIKDIYTLHL